MIRTTCLSSAILAGAALLGLCAVACAQTPAMTLSDTIGNSVVGNSGTAGYEFTVNSALTVTALGVFDDRQNGLSDSHPIGLYNNSGVLLASTTLDSGTTDLLINQFRYRNIAPTALAAGQNYRIGAYYPDSADTIAVLANGVVFDPRVTFITARGNMGVGLAFPDQDFSFFNPGGFGPNFRIVSSVPEPSSLAFFGTLCLTSGLFAVQRLRRK